MVTERIEDRDSLTTPVLAMPLDIYDEFQALKNATHLDSMTLMRKLLQDYHRYQWRIQNVFGVFSVCVFFGGRGHLRQLHVMEGFLLNVSKHKQAGPRPPIPHPPRHPLDTPLGIEGRK